MNARPADSLKIALAQLNPTVGDVAGNADKVRRARDEAQKLGAEIVAFPELFIAGYPPEDLVLKPAFQAACRSAVEALARESKSRAGAAGRHALGRGRQALQRLCAARGRRDRGDPLQGRSAELRRVRREARVRAGADARADPVQGRAHRHSDLRGHLGHRSRRMPERDRRRNPAGAERLALLARQDRAPAQHRGGARGRVRPAADLSQHGRRPGRTGVRRRVVRAQRRPQRRRAASDVSRDRGADRMEARGGRLALRRRAGRPGRTRTTRPTTAPACWACGLRRQERLQGRRARPFRRHQLRAVRGDGGGRAGQGSRALRDAAVPVHLAGLARRRGARSPRRSASTTTSCRSRARCWGSRRRSRRCSRAGRAT